ncbi:hypothetical protein [Klebsiella quasipneumoniae]|uniref:hypothetical protein n=1 Tax=Klebsiella quasipneumoniae TaxID=1463165 RepID=UPI00237E7DAF|nr:hypothetical protein [Klebsiella quasipneumoniae]MDL2151129.1 hypothetical protein [Klebsiella quasipneumoniae]
MKLAVKAMPGFTLTRFCEAWIQMTEAPRTLVAIAKGGSVSAIFAIPLFLPFIEKREKV